MPHRQVVNLRLTFVKNLSVNMKLSKAQLSKTIQLGQFPGRILGLLLKTGLPLMKNPLAKNVLIPLGLTAAVSAVDAGIHKKRKYADGTMN